MTEFMTGFAVCLLGILGVWMVSDYVRALHRRGVFRRWWYRFITRLTRIK